MTASAPSPGSAAPASGTAVSVSPERFALVFFDAAEIAAIAERVLGDVGFPAGTALRIEINEASPLGRAVVASLDPLALRVEGGAFEDPKRLRHLSARITADVLFRLLARVHDRVSGACAAAPAEADLTLAQQTGWDTYAMGRAARHGYPSQRARRLYAFRNRHGFTDVADQVFDRLWNGEGLTWADLEAACAETAGARPAP